MKLANIIACNVAAIFAVVGGRIEGLILGGYQLYIVVKRIARAPVEYRYLDKIHKRLAVHAQTLHFSNALGRQTKFKPPGAVVKSHVHPGILPAIWQGCSHAETRPGGCTGKIQIAGGNSGRRAVILGKKHVGAHILAALTVAVQYGTHKGARRKGGAFRAGGN